MRFLRIPRIGRTGRFLLGLAGILAALLLVGGLWWFWPTQPRVVLRDDGDDAAVTVVRVPEGPKADPKVIRLPFLGASVGDELTNVVVTRDGGTVATYQRSRITFWDLATERRRHVVELDGHYVDPSAQLLWLAPAGQACAFVVQFSNPTTTSGVYWWSAAGPATPTLLHEHGYIWSLADKGKLLITYEQETGFHLWNMADGRKLPPPPELVSPFFVPRALPDGRLVRLDLLAPESPGLRIWDLKRASVLTTLAEAQAPAFMSPDGAMLAARHEKSMKLWDVKTRRELATFQLAGQRLHQCEFSPDRQRLLVWWTEDTPGEIMLAGTALRLQAWDIAVAPPQLLREWHSIWAGFSADGRWLTLYDAGQGLPTLDPELPGSIWDASSMQQLPPLPDHQGWPQKRLFSPDSKSIAVRALDQQLDVLPNFLLNLLRREASSTVNCQVCDIATSRRVACIPEADCFDFFPDGQTIAVGKIDGTVEIWDIPPRRPWFIELGLPVLFGLLFLLGGWHVRRWRTGRDAPVRAS